MSNIYKNIVCMLLCMHQLYANNITIVNSTAGQVTITITTDHQSITSIAQPNENQFLNDINNPESTSTFVSYDNYPIEKISIKRISTTMPQIIYDNHETTTNNTSQPAGLFDLNTTGTGIIRVWQDTISINQYIYSILDISSIIKRVSFVRQNLTFDNFESVQKQIDDVRQSLELIDNSDKSIELNGQILITKQACMIVSGEIEIMKNLQTMTTHLQDLRDHLADDNVVETDNRIQGIAIGLQTMQTAHELQNTQSGLETFNQSLHLSSQLIQNKINALKVMLHSLQNALQMKKDAQTAINPEELISQQRQVHDEIMINNMQAMNNTGMGYYN